jgi:DNA-binding transcriptional MocR family regulator
VDDNLQQSDTTIHAALLVYLANRTESSVKDMSTDCKINENDVKTACEQLAAKGLIKARGRTRFTLCEEPTKSSSSSKAHSTTTAPAAPSAPKKAPRDAKRQIKQQQQQEEEEEEEDMQVTETIEDFDSEKEKKMPIVSSRPKLALQAARSRDAVGGHPEQKRQRDDEVGPAGSQNSADGQQNRKKKRSIIKEPIHLSSHGQHKDDDDGTDESITME